MPNTLPLLVVNLDFPGLVSLTMSARQVMRLAEKLPGWRVVACHSQEELMAALPQATGILTWEFRQEWFSLAPKLKLVATPAAGKDYFSVEWPAHIRHWNGTYHGELMAESAVGMLLGMCRGILPAVTTYRDRSWPRQEVDKIIRPLRGSRVVICGFGNIGKRIGAMLKPFGVFITGVSRHKPEAPSYFGDGDHCATVEELPEILPTTDHLVLVLPRSVESDNFLNKQRLALLPAHATVSNLGRGNAIDESALIHALTSGALAGACLDVTQVEPLPADSPLRQCPNLWITPHSSAFGANYMDLYIDEIVPMLANL